MISDYQYNRARNILVQVGSHTAGVSHPKHTQGTGSPESHGRQLLREARDEFRQLDANLPDLRSGMTQAHYNAIHQAANTMTISQW